MTVSTIRDGIKTRLATISGLNTYDTVPDNPMVPFAAVLPTGIEYDAAMADGAHAYRFGILVAVHRASEGVAQDALDAYCDATGTKSIRAAINGDRTLAGEVFSCRVTEMRNYSQLPIGETTYLGAEFVVEVYAA
jgi:hypothetical protein